MLRIALVVASWTACSLHAEKSLPDEKSRLPDLDTVLTKATSKAHDFAEQAAAMQQQWSKQQERSRAALAAKRQEYENRLQLVRQQNDLISSKNSELQIVNRELNIQNTQMFDRLKGLQDKNNQMRATLQDLTDKVSSAQLFITDSLKITDDSRASELEVLAPTTPKPTLDHFLDVTNGRKVSLLSIGSKHVDDPSALVGTLAQSLGEIQAAEEEGAAELKAHFMANLKEALDHQEMLNATQAELLKTKAELEKHQLKLLQARSHLQARNKEIRDRLEGLGVFAEKVDLSVVSTLRANATANQTVGHINHVGSHSSSVAETESYENNVSRVPSTNASSVATQVSSAFRKAAAVAPERIAVSPTPVQEAGWASWFSKLR